MPATTTPDATRRRLIADGTDLICRHGYHGTGLKAILDATGVPKGSFYNYFESKEAFGEEIVREYAARSRARLSEAIAAADDPSAGVRDYFDGILAGLDCDGCDRGCLLGLLANELGGTDGRLRAVLAEENEVTAGVIRDAFVASQERGVIRRDVEAGTLARLVLDAWSGGVTQAKVARSTEVLARELDALFRLVTAV